MTLQKVRDDLMYGIYILRNIKLMKCNRNIFKNFI